MLIWILLFICSANCTILEGGGRTYKIAEQGVNEGTRTKILDKINNYRLQVAQGNLSGQPKASNLKRLVYDIGYQSLAQADANTCKPSKTEIYLNPFKVYYYEEFEDKPRSNWDYVLDLWFAEHYHFTYPYVNARSWNYRLLVGAFTPKFGCGYSRCVHDFEWRAYNY